MTTSIDLCLIKKMVHQRYQATKSPRLKQIALNASTAMKTARDNPTMQKALAFQTAEKIYINDYESNSNLKQYAPIVINAIKTGNYTATMPNLSKLGLNGMHADPEKGTVYLAQCRTRPNQIKIGFTTQSLSKRFKQYYTRYGEVLTEYYSLPLPYPARYEKKLEVLLKAQRVAITEHGESNEWYNISGLDAISALIKVI